MNSFDNRSQLSRFVESGPSKEITFDWRLMDGYKKRQDP